MGFSAQVTIDRLTPAQVRIAMREGSGGIVGFVVFVAVLATALYALMPQVRAQPVPLFGFLAVAFGWAGIGWRAREEYILDQSTRSLTARRRGLLGQREERVYVHEISAVRLARRGPDERSVARARASPPRLPGDHTLSVGDQPASGDLWPSNWMSRSRWADPAFSSLQARRPGGGSDAFRLSEGGQLGYRSGESGAPRHQLQDSAECGRSCDFRSGADSRAVTG